MIMETKENLIQYLVEVYKNAQIKGEKSYQFDIDYNGRNFTFSIEISNKQHLLTLKDLADDIGDEMATKIKNWVK